MWLYEICTSYKHPGNINTVHGEDYSVTVTDLVSVTAHKGGAGNHRAFRAALDVPMMEDLHSSEVLSYTPRVCLSSANSQSSLNRSFSCHSFILKWIKLYSLERSSFCQTGWVGEGVATSTTAIFMLSMVV